MEFIIYFIYIGIFIWVFLFFVIWIQELFINF